MAYIESPPILSGEEAQKLEQMYRYLQRMSDQVQECLNSISVENFVPEQQTAISTILSSGATNTQLAEQSNSLKSIIVKTADIIRSEQDEIRTTLESHYQALSDQFGAYQRDLTDQITIGAEGVLQEFRVETRLNQLDTQTSELQEFNSVTKQYIKEGLLETDGLGHDVFGVEVGSHMDTDSPQRCARFTSDRLSFFQNNTEVAYLSNRKLFIGESEVLTSMKMANYVWRILSDGSLGLAWEGDE